MERERLTRTLIRMLRTVEEQRLPARVREVYVFGSYARGALQPSDLDLLVVHDDPGKDYWSRLGERLKGQGHGGLQILGLSVARFHGEMRRLLRRPGERADILLASRAEELVGPGSKVGPEDLVLVWSEQDRDFQSKLRALPLDPAAGRAPRNHLLSMKRFNGRVGVMESVVEMVEGGQLSLTRVPVSEVGCSALSTYHSHWLAHWTQCRVAGKRSLELLPLGIAWLQRHRQKAQCPHQLEMYSRSGTHRVHFGRPSLAWMLNVFEDRPRVRRQCLIPHLSKSDPNELLVFQRGPSWRAVAGG